MNQINTHDYKTLVGELMLGSFNGRLCMLDWKYRRMRTTIDNRIRSG
jgi:methylated-DNA-[protein]-cysteine S-methyltransferase